jgi:hypothetical protein
VSNYSDRTLAPRLSEPFAVVSDHNQWLAAIRRRIADLNLSYETVNDLAGLQGNYLSKIIGDPPQKTRTMFLVAQALGLDTQLVENQELIEKLKGDGRSEN